MNLETFDRQYAKKLPDAPGVYFFVGKKESVLYIGKATSLRSRARSYFSQDMLLARGPKIEKMLGQIWDIRFQKTDSVLEALLLETELIKKYAPPYNSEEKDDKSWNFVVITKEKFPRVLTERGKKLAKGMDERDHTEKELLGYAVRYRFGPFPNGGDLKVVLRIVRKIFPYRDTCIPFDANLKDGKQGKRCFNASIGLCPGVCLGSVSAREYAKTIRRIKLFFEGRKEMIRRDLEHDMRRYAKELQFEKAEQTKSALFAIDHISDAALLTRRIMDDSTQYEKNDRIEAYDVAHTGGSETVGVMTVVGGGIPEKSQYRKFIIRGDSRGNDLLALEELLRRRFSHMEWPLPSMIVVDGSDIQRQVAEAVLRDVGVSVPLVSVLKDEHHKPKDILSEGVLSKEKKRDILLANSEAHRFAITFHRKRRGKKFLGK